MWKFLRILISVSYISYFCKMNVVLEFETYDKGFYENFIFQEMKGNYCIE